MGKENHYISKEHSNININKRKAGKRKKNVHTFLRDCKLHLPMFLYFIWFSHRSPTEYYERMIHNVSIGFKGDLETAVIKLIIKKSL